MEEALRSQLSALADLYEAATGTPRASMSRRALNDNKFFLRLAAGDGFTVRTFDRMCAWFWENWPADLEWPADVARPVEEAQAGEGSSSAEAALP